jgi:hypothetical protein
VGHDDLTTHVGSDGIRYYEAQASSLSGARKQGERGRGAGHAGR